MNTPSQSFEYPWDQAPEGAAAATTDADGTVCWWRDYQIAALTTLSCSWHIVDDKTHSLSIRIDRGGSPCPTWRDSLRARPVGGVEGGWRLLDADESIAAGDECYNCEKWVPIPSVYVGRSVLAAFNPIRRRICPPQVEPVFGGEAVGFVTPADLDALPGGRVVLIGPHCPEKRRIVPLYTHPAPDRVAGEGEIEALRKDAELLRWLIENYALERLRAKYRPEGYGSHAERIAKTREAIDTAIASTLAPTALNGGE